MMCLVTRAAGLRCQGLRFGVDGLIFFRVRPCYTVPIGTLGSWPICRDCSAVPCKLSLQICRSF